MKIWLELFLLCRIIYVFINRIFTTHKGNTSHEEQRTFHLCPSHKHQSSLFWRDYKQIKPHSKSISKIKCRQPEFSQKVRAERQPGESTEPIQNNMSTGRCLTPADCWDYSHCHSDTAARFHSSRHQRCFVSTPQSSVHKSEGCFKGATKNLFLSKIIDSYQKKSKIISMLGTLIQRLSECSQ